MSTAILNYIDEEISRLQKAKALLSNLPELSAEVTAAERRGRPAGSTKFTVASKSPRTAGKRIMSAEGKAKIVAAQKKRWSAQKKAA